MERNGGATPTGCFKCGRPGHWSRDCPSSSSATNPNSNLPSSSATNPNPSFSRPSFKSGGDGGGGGFQNPPLEKKTEKPKKEPRKIPKLTPEVLLSNDGLGYVLRHFPKSFKFRGRGHEVSDLENLIGLYSQWHSHLLPYYSFDQFVHKVEQVGASKRVRTCVRELRERVSNGGDPTKLHEPPVEHEAPNYEPPAAEEANNVEKLTQDIGSLAAENHDADDVGEEILDDVQEEMLDDIYKSATAEPCESSQSQLHTAPVRPDNNPTVESANQISDNGASSSSNTGMTQGQKARIEANRLNALERAAARARSSHAS